MDEDMALDEQAQLSDDEDIGSAHIPKASALASNYSPPPEDSLLVQTGDIAMFMDWFCKRRGITELKPQDLEGPAFEIVKVFHPDRRRLYNKVQCQQTITTGWSTWSSHKPKLQGRPALSISKMKAAYYPDVGLEQMVPDQFWIEEECKYDIAAMRKCGLINYKSLLEPISAPPQIMRGRAITELVYLIEAHHLNPMSIPKCDGLWRIDDCVVVFVFKARGIPSRFGEVQLSLVALNP
nr:hypothetical protein [Tanacetum cinerariifolium]